MLKIYAKREEEMRLLPLLAEFKARVIVNYPIKGVTRKVRGKGYKVINAPLQAKRMWGTTDCDCDACTNEGRITHI